MSKHLPDPLPEEKQSSQHQSIGEVGISGEKNVFAQVSAAGNAAIDQSRHVIYNYYYQQESTRVAVKSTVTPNDNLTCPYRGLFHFGPEDKDFFFGREVFVAELEQAVQTRAFITVLGASGSGKSSVVLAGLVPRLQQTRHWLFSHFRPGDDPFHALALALVPLYAPEQDATDQIAQARKLAAYLQAGEVQLDDAIARIQHNYPNQRVLLIADQFEELYTLCLQEETQRQFLDCLLASLANTSAKSSPLVLVATMRADFLGSGLTYRPFADVLQGSDVKLGVMNSTELREVIEQPAAKLGVTFEAGLVERILKDVAHAPGNLPLLEFALTELWKQRSSEGLTHIAYEAIGQVEGSLARYADAQYAQLSAEAQAQVRRIFIQLVRPGEGAEDTRRLATKAELGDERWALVKQLADTRLVITSQNETRQETVEVVHEALIRNWGELRGWMTADRAFRAWQERLRSAMQQWDATQQDEGALLRGAALTEAKEQLEKRQTDLGEGEETFIQASLTLQEEEKEQQKQRLRRAQQSSVLFGAIAVVAIVAGGWAWTQQQRAMKGKINADFLADGLKMESYLAAGLEKEAVELAMQTAQDLNHQSTRHLEPGNSFRALSSIREVIFGVQEQERLIGHSDEVKSVAYSPDGKNLATASGDKTVKLWDLNGTELNTLEGHSDVIHSVVYSPDGKTLATASEDNTVKLWSLDGTELHTLEGHSNAVNSVTYSPDSQTIVTASSDKTVKLWSLGGTELHTLEGHSDTVWSVAYSPDGQAIATASGDQTVKLWNVDGTLIDTLEGHSGVVWNVAYSPDGETLATASWDNTVKLWNMDGTLINTLESHDDAVNSVAYSPDSETLATASIDKTVKLWRIDDTELNTLKGHGATVNSVVYSPDGTTLATASWDKTVKLWRIDGTEFKTLNGHSEAVTSVVYSPDGETLATASIDKTVKLWNLDGTLIDTLEGHSDVVNSVAYSPDGETLASASSDNTVKLWNFNLDSLITIGCGWLNTYFIHQSSEQLPELESCQGDFVIK